MNKNFTKSKYEPGEVIFSMQNPGNDWVKLDGSTKTIVSNDIYNKITKNKTSVALSQSSVTSFLNVYENITSNFGTTNINSIAYDGTSTYIAVGPAATLRSSTDNGATWNTQTSGFGTSNINVVAYAAGTWVAGGAQGFIRTSNNNWNTFFSAASNLTSSIDFIIYGNNLWMTGSGSAGNIRTSTNAIAWNTVTASGISSGGLSYAAYGLSGVNPTWATASTSVLKTSTDNATIWTTQTINFGTSAIGGIAYGNGVWVLAGQAGTLRTSTNATTWVTQSALSMGSVGNIFYGGGLFYAIPSSVNTSQNKISVSTNGTTWILKTMNISNTNNLNQIVVDENSKNALTVGNAGTIINTKNQYKYIVPNVYLGNNIYGWMKT